MFEAESDDLRTIKAMPLWMGFLAAVIAPVLIAIVFGLLNSKENPLLLQLELMLVAIAFCLTGILTRSKLLGLLSIIAAPVSWAILFFLEMLTGGFILNPYGIFSGIRGPVSAIAKSGIIEGMEANLNLITQLAVLLDLIFVEILAIFLGIFLSTLATGIWTKKGELSIFSCIVKPIAAIFTIIILILVPITYHAVSNSLYGVITLGAGAAEFGNVFGIDLSSTGGGSGAQTGFVIDFNNETQIEELVNASQRAAEWFQESANAFDQVQGNFLATILVDILLSNYGMENALVVLDFPEILASIATEVPDLMAGYQGLVQGFDLTFSVLGGTDLGGGFGGSINKMDATYNDTFNDGLELISDALTNFSNAEEGVKDALAKSEDIIRELNVSETGNVELAQIIKEAQIGYGIILEVAEGGIFFLNATYKTTLAVEDLGDVDFVSAHDWMAEATEDLTDANETLQAIDTKDLKKGYLPFWGTVEIISDMTELLTYFARAATNGTECYMEIEDVVIALNDINFAGEDLDTISSDLNSLSTNVSETRNTFIAAQNNIGNATALSNTFVDKDYGNIIDDAFKPMLIDFNNMLNTFSTNVTEIAHLLTALDYTLFSAYSFTEGLNLFNQTYNAVRADTATGAEFLANFSVNPDVDRSIDFMDFAIDNGSAGCLEIDKTSVISSDLTVNWKNTLHHPYPPDDPDDTLTADPKSIAGLSLGVKGFIQALKTLADLAQQEEHFGWINQLFDDMDEVGFDQIFGGG
ncbi:MAG: hypothetical protein ACFFFH_13240 [Candidatus Thorarchaeota archaeon]